MAKKRGRKSKRLYFTEDTELAIVEYLASDDQHLRNRIYNDRIHHSFYKLAENLIHTFKFYYTEVDDLEDLKHEVICFLLEKLHYFKVGKGKAFSYFSIVGKNYLILYNNKNYAKKKGKADLLDADTDNSILNNMENIEKLAEKVEFLDIFVEKADNKLESIFNKHDDILVAEAVLMLFKKRATLEIFNKKALYIYIREITGCDTPAITKVTKILQKYYIKAFNQWETGQPIVL
mgnify:CR=1 FL=1|tara:strand:+ start:570 stop:1271 length:702 start_codon:yes stop_codon:yes gene_type:complete